MRSVAAAALAVLALAVVLPGAAGSVEIVSRDHPDPVVYDRRYPVNVTVRNTGDEARHVRLFATIYRPDGSPCGPAGGDDFRGRASDRDVPLDVPPRGTASYPGDGDIPWWHLINASNEVEGGGTIQVCTFAYDPTENTTEERFLDVLYRNVTLRMTNEAPTGEATVDPEQGTLDTVFRFTATADDAEGDPIRYRWDFHDWVPSQGRATARGPSVTHEFYPEGTYTVNLTLSDGWDERVLQLEVPVYPPGELPGGGGGPVPGPGVAALAAGVAAAAWVRRR